MSSYFERSESLRKSLEAVAFSFVSQHDETIYYGYLWTMGSNWALGLFSMRIIGKNDIINLYFLEEKAGYEITLYRYSPFFDQGLGGGG